MESEPALYATGRTANALRYFAHSAVRNGTLSTVYLSLSGAVDLHHLSGRDPRVQASLSFPRVFGWLPACEARVQSLNHRTVEVPCNTAPQVMRRLVGDGRRLSGESVLALPVVDDALIGDCGHVKEKLTQVRAAARTSQCFFNGPAPARPHRNADHTLHRTVALLTFAERCVVHRTVYRLDDHGFVYRRTNKQPVYRRAHRQQATFGCQRLIASRVGHLGFDIPQAVVAQEATVSDSAGVQVPSRRWSWQWHGVGLPVLIS